jgi:hypothetical protein
MARIETILDDLGKPLEIINIDCSVGANGVNNFSDVRAVKALLKDVPRYYSTKTIKNGGSGLGKELSWNYSNAKIPSPYDGTTWGVAEVTRSFQKYANKMLSKYGYRVNVSGTIKPAKGRALVGKNFSTIAALNIFASLGAHGFESHIEKIISSYNGIFEYLVEEEDEDGSD